MIEQTLASEYHDLAGVQKENEDKLMGLANVVGCAVGHKVTKGQDTGERSILVLVEQKLPPAMLGDKDKVPGKVKGMTTDVVEVGTVFAGGGPSVSEAPSSMQVGAQALTRRTRPAMGGMSVGHFRITAGTLGTCCYDARDFPGIPRSYYILSNNHVLANSNDANLGDPILQPGPFDGGTMPGDVIARLSRFVPIRFISGSDAPCNFVDAAIAEGDFADLNREIYWVGYLRRMYTAPRVGDLVQKTGRTTNFTTGQVQAVNATVNVNYGGGRVARFCNQILTSAMSAGGDSGSVVTNLEEEGVGLLFAGSATITILNHLSLVQSALGVRITEN
jgi:hypothetical protein